MPFDGTLDFVRALEAEGELRRISVAVDPVLEMTAMADRLVKSNGPAVVFENAAGSLFSVAIGMYGSDKRMAMALGVTSLDEAAKRIADLVALPSSMPPTMLGKAMLLPGLAKIGRDAAPRIVGKGRCQDIVWQGDDVKLTALPVLKCWPLDGGRFITLPMVFTKDPVTGNRNVGMYRVQVYDDKTAGMHWQRHKVGSRHHAEYEAQNKPIPVAVALGGDPCYAYSATAPLPDGIDEMAFAGFLRKKPVDMVRCKTVDIEVPADCDFVLEGFVAPGERRIEGPFGDHTGFYTLEEPYPVFHITAITMRSDAIYPATIVGRPPREDGWLGKATERLFLPLVRLFVPEIIDYNLPVEGTFHHVAIVKIRKRFPGHARKVMHALWGLGQMMFSKIIIVVDESVDVQNLGEVLWAVSNNIDPQRDTEFVMGPIDVLDHAARVMGYGSKMGIDATRKLPEEGFNREWPPVIEMTPDVQAKADALLINLGLMSELEKS